MESKVISVFYDNLCYPFKDSARSIRYPIVGNTFAGTNKTTEIRFYVDRMGGTNGISWVVVSKLPNGKLGYELLSTVGNDTDLNEQYLSFSVSSYYTQYKGVVKLALRGYQGEITFTESVLNPGVYEINGDPLIEVTGTIDLAINYSPFVNTGTTILPTDLDQILAWLADYLNIANGIVSYTPSASFDLREYSVGQVFYNKTYRYFEQKTGDNTLGVINLSNHAKLVGGNTFEGVNTFNGNNVYNGYSTFNEDLDLRSVALNLINSLIVTSDKTKFALVETQQDEQVFYNLPYDFGDLGESKTFTLETKEDVDDMLYVYALTSNYPTTITLTSEQANKLKANPHTKIMLTLTNNAYKYCFEYIGYVTGVHTWACVTYDMKVLHASIISSTQLQINQYANTLATRDYVNTQVSALGNVFEYKGTKTVSELNTLASGLTSANIGDTYNVSDSGTLTAGSVVVEAGDNVTWNGSAWDKLAGTVDLSGYVQKTTTIAGIDLQDNITASELANAINDELNATNETTDVDYIMGVE